MDSKKVLCFLDILNRHTTEHSDELLHIYKRALDENDLIIQLKNALNDNQFYGEIGQNYYNNGVELLKKIYSSPVESHEFLTRIKQTNEMINNASIMTDELMHSPYPFSESISIIQKNNVITYLRSLRMIASAIVYLALLYSGVEQISDLSWNDNAGIQEMIYAVNTRFIPLLCSVKRPNHCWMVIKRRLGGKALFGGDYFFLKYYSIKETESLCSSIKKEAISTHAFLNINAYESNENDVPYCWGIGNIITFSPLIALDCLQKNITVKLRSPNQSELKRKIPTPIQCSKILSDETLACITPDELLNAMNQWQLGHEIEVRRQVHNCLFCGKYLNSNRLVCKSHFLSELR